ncbi:ComEC/Rec2 family competence protein [Rothia sp. 88186D007BW]
MRGALTTIRGWQQSQAERAEHRRVQPRLVDARLVFPAVGLWGFTALWILAGARWTLGFGAFLLALALGAWCVSHRFSPERGWWGSKKSAQILAPFAQVLALTCLLIAVQTVALQGRGYLHQWDLMQSLHGQGVRVSAIVVDARPSSTGGYKVQVETREIRQGLKSWDEHIRLSVYTDQLLLPGSRVSAAGALKVKGSYYRLQGKVSLIEPPGTVGPTFLLKTGLRDVAVEQLGAGQAGLLLGMAYGDDSSLPAQALSSLRIAGLTHLTAVSGANITLIFVVAYRLFYSLCARPCVLIVVGVAASTGYVVLVGLDGSVLRAWVMGLVGALGLVLGHGAYRLTFLSTCLMALVIAVPPLATHYGFILSVVATASLVVLAPAISRLLSRGIPLLLADLLAMPCAASLWCAPVILVLSESLYPYTILANLAVTPLVAPLTVLGLLAFLTYSLGLADPVLNLLLSLGGFLAQGLLNIAVWCASLPGSQLPVELTPLTVGLTFFAVVGISWLVLTWDRVANSLPEARLPRLHRGNEL